MFERNRIDNTLREPVLVPVELELATGEIEKGKLSVPIGHAPLDVLNGQGSFVEFEPYGGAARRFVSKATIARVVPVGVPRQPYLTPPKSTNDDFNPHQILGVSPESTWDEIRQAYVQLSKTYHPDRYENAILPDEVHTYLSAMVRRINAAYAALDAVPRAPRPMPARRSEPVYTSKPR